MRRDNNELFSDVVLPQTNEIIKHFEQKAVFTDFFILKEDKASGGLQRCADVLCHAKHDAHLAASTPRRT